MKLFQKYNRINIIASILIFIAGCIAFYFVLNYVLVKQLDEALETEQEEIMQFAEKHSNLPEIINTDDQQVYFAEVATPVLHQRFSSVKTWNQLERKKEWMRKFIFGFSLNQKNYLVTILRSQEERKGFLKLVVAIAAGMIAMILLAGYIINRVVLKRLWQPFYQSIQQISSYDLQLQRHLNLPVTTVDEFTLLNSSLNQMAAKAETDYHTLKEFTGNAAHEMQTPLAVITANTESLIQDETVLKNHHAAIATIDNAAKRLSRLNQSLLLLARIENRRFELNEKVEWETMLLQRLQALDDLIAARQLQVSLHTIPVTTIFHQHLADILLTNLLSNAIRYNRDGGSMAINLDETSLMVSNNSLLPALDSTKIFNRFYRHPETKADGSGLGLSIVQQICKEAGYQLNYQYSNNLHIFSILFDKR
jgi:two-component system, OmpR family, sensor histidine kinase QseC